MKKYMLLFVSVLAVVCFSTFAFAGVTNFDAITLDADSADTYQLRVNNTSGTRVFSVNSSGNAYVAGTVAVTGTATLSGDLSVSGTLTNSRERGFTLPIIGFIFGDGAPITTSTTPGFEVDDLIPNIVWADGEASPVMITFRIPTDYSSGGAFRLICTESDSTTPNQVDFDVYTNRDGTAADASATGQTPVALAGTTSTPDVVTLTPATDFASLAAGDWVTLRIWRDDTATGTGDLEVKGVEFFYTASH